MAKPKLVENADQNPSNVAVFVRRKGRKDDPNSLYQGREIQIPMLHEILGVDLGGYSWVEPEQPSDLPKGLEVKGSEIRYDNLEADAVQECIRQTVVQRYRLKQSNSGTDELTDDGLAFDAASLVQMVEDYRAPITRAKTGKTEMVSALKEFIKQVCAEKGIKQSRDFVWKAIQKPSDYPAMDSGLRRKLDNFVSLFRASDTWKDEYSEPLQGALDALDAMRAIPTDDSEL